MSADNYLLIRRAGERFAVTDESASAQLDADGDPLGALRHPGTLVGPGVEWFDSLEDARAHAYRTYSEYGVVEDVERDATGDTFAARPGAAAAALAGSHREELRTNDRAAGTATLHVGDVTVTVASADGDWDAVCRYAVWLSATTPESLARLGGAPGS